MEGLDLAFILKWLNLVVIPLGLWLVTLQRRVDSKAEDEELDALRERVSALETSKADKSQVTEILVKMGTMEERLNNSIKGLDRMETKLDIVLSKLNGQS